MNTNISRIALQPVRVLQVRDTVVVAAGLGGGGAGVQNNNNGETLVPGAGVLPPTLPNAILTRTPRHLHNI